MPAEPSPLIAGVPVIGLGRSQALVAVSLHLLSASGVWGTRRVPRRGSACPSLCGALSYEPAGVRVRGAPVFLACSAWGGAHPGRVAWVGKRGERGNILDLATFLKP